MVSPTPPRGNLSAIGAPSSTKTKHATASANFLLISTESSFITAEDSFSLFTACSTCAEGWPSVTGDEVALPTVGLNAGRTKFVDVEDSWRVCACAVFTL